MLGLSATYNYFLSYGSVDMRKGCFSLSQLVRDEMKENPLDGKAEISNNLVEQRMKPIKLDLKNSQNIGSEVAAKRHAFMHSLIESCSMNKITPYGYLVNMLERYKTLTEEEKPALMPCYYKNNLKN
jgi:hypothetical protein